MATDHLKAPWVFREIGGDDGFGYVSIDGIDALHVGARELSGDQNRAVGNIAAAAPVLVETLRLAREVLGRFCPGESPHGTMHAFFECGNALAAAGIDVGAIDLDEKQLDYLVPERVRAAAPELLALAEQYLSECAACSGTGVQVGVNPAGDYDKIFDADCADCKFIRDVIAKAKAP